MGMKLAPKASRAGRYVSCAWLALVFFFGATAPALAQIAPPQVTTPGTAGEADPLLMQARTLIQQGRAAEAEGAVRQYLASGKDSEAAHVLLGLILYEEQKPADSLGEFTRAAKFAKPRASELVVVGLDYVALRDLASADRWMSLATQMDPADAAAWRYLGGIKYSENRFAEAIAAYTRVLQLRPRDVLSEDGMGRSLEGLSRGEDAERAYRTALEWQADAEKKYPQPLLHLGSLLIRRGQAQAAIPLLAQVEALDPEDADVHEQLGEAWVQVRELSRAQAELEKALSLSPANSHLHWLLASVYRREGMKEQAERETKAYAALLGSHSSDKLH